MGIPTGEDNESEDCLFLNVWTPALADGVRRPVMVRLHGGGYMRGSGSWAWADGTNLARRGDVVVVTVNHRLGVLGYLNVAKFGGEDYQPSGAVGMLDLVAALEWVRDNIAAFGGDPGNVTIFGESGGGHKVTTLLAMRSAVGLFHRAIVQSGAGLRGQAPDESAAVADRVAAEVGATSIADLQEVPVGRLLDAGRTIPFFPTVDGSALPAHPVDAVRSGASTGVPLLVGTTRYEMTLLLARAGSPERLADTATRDSMPLEDVSRRLSPLLGDRTETIIAGYRDIWPRATTGELLVLIHSDFVFRMPSIRLAEAKLEGGRASPYMYLTTWETSAADGLLKSSHALDVPLTMDNIEAVPATASEPTSRQVANRMSNAWIAFARDGDPNHDDLPKWPSYSLDERATMLFDVECSLVGDPSGERALWDGVL